MTTTTPYPYDLTMLEADVLRLLMKARYESSGARRQEYAALAGRGLDQARTAYLTHLFDAAEQARAEGDEMLDELLRRAREDT